MSRKISRRQLLRGEAVGSLALGSGLLQVDDVCGTWREFPNGTVRGPTVAERQHRGLARLMKIGHVIHVVDSHTCGHPTRLVLAGLPSMRGQTVREKQEYFASHYDDFRGAILHEPRGHAAMFAAVLTEPGDPEADVGLIFVSTYKYPRMCGHGTIGALTTLVELGMLKATGPTARFRVEVPDGTIDAEVVMQDGDVTAVTFENVPSYVWKRNLVVWFEGKKIPVDICYSGVWYVLVDAHALGMPLHRGAIHVLMDRATALKESVNGHLKGARGDPGPIVDSALVYDYAAADRHLRNVVVLAHNKCDRSPCGTGTSAVAALLVDRGMVREGDRFKSEGILGTTFGAEVRRVLAERDRTQVIPAITGRAYITGISQLVIDSTDPLKVGFLLA